LIGWLFLDCVVLIFSTGFREARRRRLLWCAAIVKIAEFKADRADMYNPVKYFAEASRNTFRQCLFDEALSGEDEADFFWRRTRQSVWD
jgi:hypothetical protein